MTDQYLLTVAFQTQNAVPLRLPYANWALLAADG